MNKYLILTPLAITMALIVSENTDYKLTPYLVSVLSLALLIFNDLMKVKKVSKSNSMTLKEAMNSDQRAKLGNLPTTHRNCLDKCGVARPGKTRRDKIKRGEM